MLLLFSCSNYCCYNLYNQKFRGLCHPSFYLLQRAQVGHACIGVCFSDKNENKIDLLIRMSLLMFMLYWGQQRQFFVRICLVTYHVWYFQCFLASFNPFKPWQKFDISGQQMDLFRWTLSYSINDDMFKLIQTNVLL